MLINSPEFFRTMKSGLSEVCDTASETIVLMDPCSLYSGICFEHCLICMLLMDPAVP